jgi:DNA-binding NtrC family response regulator
MNINSKGKILIVDDEESLCDLLGDTLTTEGYEVTKTYDGQTAINLLGENEYDAAVIDLLLPQKNGMDILKYALEKKKPTKIIMATGYGEMSTTVEAIKLGAFDFLTKPFDINNLKLILKKAIEIKKEEDIQRIKNPVKDELAPEQTEIPGTKNSLVSAPDRDVNPDAPLAPEEEEKRKILAVLKDTNWNKSKSADLLGISLKELYSKIKNLGLKP